uniref:Secreted protein n=1 Tax=Heterorhabditis bacteriophora TaxID=37862 RepID=A0A1I7WDJ7_HETBA
MICLSSAAQVTYLLAVYTTRHISYVGIHRYILLISFMSPYRRHVILERGTFNSTPLDVVLSVSPNSRLMNFQHFRLLNNPEPDVPKGKPNGAVRSKLHHSKRLQFVVNNAACCVFHRYANQPIHLCINTTQETNDTNNSLRLSASADTYVTNVTHSHQLSMIFCSSTVHKVYARPSRGTYPIFIA